MHSRSRVKLGLLLVAVITIPFVYLMASIDSPQYLFNPTARLHTMLIGILVYVALIMVIVVMVFMPRLTSAKQLSSQEAEEALANVLAIKDTGIIVANVYYVVELTVEVHSTSQGVFQATFEARVPRVQVPRIGSQVRVLFNRHNRDQIALKL